jgi:hypothetical protein
VSITQVAIYQGPKRVLMGGMQTGTVLVPVVAGRDALVRVFVQTDSTYDGSPVTAHLFLGQGSTPIEVVGMVSSASSEDALASTINFNVPGASIVPGITYRVELVQATSKGDNPAASTPAGGGFDPLGADTDGTTFKLVVVPVQYGADGSNRLPDTSAAQIQAYKDAFMATYPIAGIDVSVGAPFPWTGAVDASGNGWNDLLTAMADYRQQQGAPNDTYYFGAFDPADSFDTFCGGGCVAGLGWVGSATDTWSRAAVGLGYSGSLSTDTSIHEIGHNQGRNHAPCGGAQGVDPNFPYANGDIGDWGYNLITQQLIQPGQASDIMGYCDPRWISDYTFAAIFTNLKAVNNAEIVYPLESLDRLWERAKVDAQGNLTWLSSTQLHLPPQGQAIPVTVQTAGGASVAGGHLYAYDHLPGGVLFWPAGAQPTTSVQVTLAGQVKTLRR